MKKLFKFLFVPSMESMGMGCLLQLLVWIAIIATLVFFSMVAYIFYHL